MNSTRRIADPARFIRDNTRLQPVSHTPEVSLWLADEVTPIWRLTEEELGEMGLPPPFWAFAWAGGQALARWLLDHPQAVEGRRVLDLATGSGLVGIAAMKAGAASVLAADIDPSAPPPSLRTLRPTASRSPSPPTTCWRPRPRPST